MGHLRGGRGPPALALALALAPVLALALALAAPAGAQATTPSDMFNGVPAILSRLREEAVNADDPKADDLAPLVSVKDQATSWICKAWGYHDGTNREDTFVAPRCLGPDGQDLDLNAIPGMRYDSSIWTPEEMNTAENKAACELYGGEYDTAGSICAATYLDEEDFSFEKFAKAWTGGAEEQLQGMLGVIAPACCGAKPLDDWRACQIWSGGAEADGVDRSRNVVSLECHVPEGSEVPTSRPVEESRRRLQETDVTLNATLMGFETNGTVVSREELLSRANFEKCESFAEGARVEINACGPGRVDSASLPLSYMPYVVPYVGKLCCPGEEQSADMQAATIAAMMEDKPKGPEYEAESWLCREYGFHDGKDRSSPDGESVAVSVKCRDSRLGDIDNEGVDCERVPGMVCETGVFGAGRLAGAANKQACAEHFDGAGVVVVDTCSGSSQGLSPYDWIDENLEGQPPQFRDYMVGFYGPKCCGAHPNNNLVTKMCDSSPLAGPPDGKDRSNKLVNVDCVKKALNSSTGEMEKDESFEENVPGFKYQRLHVPGQGTTHTKEELLSQENLDTCLAAGGTGFEFGTCATFAYYATMFDLNSEAGKGITAMVAPECCTLSEEEKNRPKSGPEMEKASWLCQKWGHHDGTDHAGKIFGASCKAPDGTDFESDDIKGFKSNTLLYSGAELDSPANKAACEAHAEGATLELSSCDMLFTPYVESALSARPETEVQMTVNMVGPACCGQSPLSEVSMCKDVDGEERPLFGGLGVFDPETLVSVECVHQKGNGEENETLRDVPGFKALNVLGGFFGEYSREELLGEKNEAACLAAGGDKVEAANCATMQAYLGMGFLGEDLEKYLPALRHACCGAPAPPTQAPCGILKSIVDTARRLSDAGAPKVRRNNGGGAPFVRQMGLDYCPLGAA